MSQKWIRGDDWIVPARYPIEIKIEDERSIKILVIAEKRKFADYLVIPPKVKDDWISEEAMKDLYVDLWCKVHEMLLKETNADILDFDDLWWNIWYSYFKDTIDHFEKKSKENNNQQKAHSPTL